MNPFRPILICLAAALALAAQAAGQRWGSTGRACRRC